ncbi:MAG TPA: diguanylate cyclase, partial [Motiliproteus sp.]
SVIHPSTYGVDFYSDILFTSTAQLQQSPEQVRRFREASLRGWQYAMEHPEQVISLILAEYSQEKSRDHLEFEAQAMRDLIMPTVVELGHMNPGRWQHMAATFVKQGMVEPGFDLDGFIYDPFPDNDRSRWRHWVIGLAIGLGIIGLVLVVLVLYNRRLQSAINYGHMVQDKLRNQTALFEAIFRSNPDGTLLVDEERHVVMSNPAFGQIFGYRAEEVLGQSTAMLYDDYESFVEQGYKRFNPSAEVQMRTYEQRYRRKNGELFPGQSVGGPIVNLNGESLGYLLVVRDITEQKRSEQAIIRMALTDSLTGLGNRHHFNHRLDELAKLSKRQDVVFTLLLMDLDHFKAVNDNHGHPLGDELLRQVGLELRGVFRETDLVARIGGDEFAVIMVEQSDPSAIRLPAERVIERLSRPLTLDGKRVQIGASIGVATFPQDSNDATELYRLADKALYCAKEQGRNQCVFYQQLNRNGLCYQERVAD